MSPILKARAALTVVGLVVWGYGVRNDLPDTRIAGIGVLMLVFFLRFVRSKPPAGE